MRIIKETRLKDFIETNPLARKEVALWVHLVRSALWRNWADAKKTFGHRLDMVKVASGNTVGVFDLRNNKWRMICPVHFDSYAPRRGKVFIMRILTHAEYDLNHWKQEL